MNTHEMQKITLKNFDFSDLGFLWSCYPCEDFKNIDLMYQGYLLAGIMPNIKLESRINLTLDNFDKLQKWQENKTGMTEDQKQISVLRLK